jgi:hypothetical protein
MSNKKEAYIDRDKIEQYIQEGAFTIEKHDDCDLYIYGYHASGSVLRTWNDITINCRGLILNNKGKILARPFTKFFTFRKYLSKNTILMSEGQVIEIPDCNYKIYDKLDGSLAILYWVEDKPYLASQRSFKSPKAKKATEILYKKYQHVFGKLKKDRTYLFEAIYPEARVAVDYGDIEDLYLISIIDNYSGRDLPIENIGFPIVEDLTEQFEYAEDLNSIQSINMTNREGVVIVYDNGLRVKVKYPHFQKQSQLISKIVDHDRFYYKLLKHVKSIYGLPQNELTSEKIWILFNKGFSVESVKIFIPQIFYHCGVQEWLSEEYSSFVEVTNINSKSNLKEAIIPKVNRVFDFQKEMVKAKSEMVMWNLIRDINKTFD